MRSKIFTMRKESNLNQGETRRQHKMKNSALNISNNCFWQQKNKKCDRDSNSSNSNNIKYDYNNNSKCDYSNNNSSNNNSSNSSNSSNNINSSNNNKCDYNSSNNNSSNNNSSNNNSSNNNNRELELYEQLDVSTEENYFRGTLQHLRVIRPLLLFVSL